MKRSALIAIICTAASLGSCGTFGLYSSDHSTLVAKVGQIELRSSALDNIYGGAVSATDSTAVREAFVASWIRSEVKRQAAEQALLGEKAEDIERMVEEYRTQLLTYKYENEYIDNHIDTTVTNAQIAEYYKNNKETFRLAGPMVKAIVARIPTGLRQSTKLEDMFRGKKEGWTEDFINICHKNSYRIDDFRSQWTDFSVVLQHIPFTQKNFDEFLKKSDYYEVSDTEWKYMMKIAEYMPSGALSPEERERDQIKKILKNLRRTELLRSLDDSLHSTATQMGIIKIEKE